MTGQDSSPEPMKGQDNSPEPIIVQDSSPEPMKGQDSSPQPIKWQESSPEPMVGENGFEELETLHHPVLSVVLLQALKGFLHEVRKYVNMKSTTVYTVYVLSSELGFPHPFPAGEWPLPPGTKGGGHTRLRVRCGGAPIPTTGEKA